jgi:hypothetical protein
MTYEVFLKKQDEFLTKSKAIRQVQDQAMDAQPKET